MMFAAKTATMLRLPVLLDRLEEFHGGQVPECPTDPYLFIVWWHCGYPASDVACAKGWTALTAQVGVTPEKLLSASSTQLTAALKPGGMVPELRAVRLQQIAERIQKEFDGDLFKILQSLPLAKARAALKKFPNIADPGADRILLLGGISAVAAVASNCPQVLVRIRLGRERENYGVTYREAQDMVKAEVAETFAARTRAYLLLKRHGQQLCKRTNPKCGDCPIAADCAFYGGNMRGRPVLLNR